jgi:hypothetical protein
VSQALTIPAVAQEAIASMQEQLTAACGDDLVAVIAYGSAVTGRFRPRFSDVNLMIVLARSSYEALQQIRGITCDSRQAVPVDPLVVTQQELPAAAEAFPVKFLEMKQAYRVLSGVDVLAGLEIPQDRLLWRCRQEAVNIAWRFRRGLTVRPEDVDVDQIVARLLPRVFSVLRALVMLQTGEWLISRDEVLERAGGLFEIPRESLSRLLEWKKEQLDLPPELWEQAAEDFAAATEALVEAAHAD